jgi:ABC-type dipeptide/oligopeptide/nickel transport system permease component
LSELVEPAARRILALVPVLIGVSLLVFALTEIGLGDPARAMLGQRADPLLVQQIRRDYALDQPVHVRYAAWMGRLLRGDLGTSYHQQRPVTEVIAERLPATAHLALAATAVAVVAGLAAGIAAALRPGRLLDQALMTAAVLGISTPVFWLGMMLSLLFAVWLDWLPVSGYCDGAWANLVLPALTLGAIHTGTIARMTRASLLEVVRQEYIQTARAKGLAEWRVVGKHALRNALIPVVTVIGIGLADLLVGAPLTETVFAWPGLGRMLVAAVGQRDLPVVMGAVLVFAVIYVLANLVVDLAYLVIDPRIRRAR